MVIHRVKGSKTLYNVKTVETYINPLSFLGIHPTRKEVPPSRKLQEHEHESKAKEQRPRIQQRPRILVKLFDIFVIQRSLV